MALPGFHETLQPKELQYGSDTLAKKRLCFFKSKAVVTIWAASFCLPSLFFPWGEFSSRFNVHAG